MLKRVSFIATAYTHQFFGFGAVRPPEKKAVKVGFT